MKNILSIGFAVKKYIQEVNDKDFKQIHKDFTSDDELHKSITAHHATMPKGTTYKQAGSSLMKKRANQLLQPAGPSKAETVASLGTIGLLGGGYLAAKAMD